VQIVLGLKRRCQVKFLLDDLIDRARLPEFDPVVEVAVQQLYS